MAKARIQEHRFDFRGGYNDYTSPVLLEPNQMPTVRNARLDSQSGQLALRLGSRRLHATALGASVDGLIQWGAPGGLQLVAIANGDLHHKATDFGAFASVSPTPALGSARPTSLALMRQSVDGAPLRLYLADGVGYHRWTGSALTQIGGTLGLPASVDLVRVYHLRNFLKSSTYGQHAFWTVLGDPEDGTVGARTGGGSAMVDVLRGATITAMEVVGSSLLIGTDNSLVRFTGYDNQDIQIDQDTEGISAVVGPVGPNALVRVESFAAMIAGTGTYAVTEREAQLVSTPWSTLWRGLDRSALANACLAYHEGTREIWVALPGAGDSGQNRTIMVYSLDLGVWYGPYLVPFGITCMTRWVDSAGDEHLAAGCADGFVRVLDYQTSGLDDVLSDDTGGSAISARVDFAPTFFEPGPGFDKTLTDVFVHLVAGASELVTVSLARDNGAYVSLGTVGNHAGTQNDSTPARLQAYATGDRFQLRMEWSDPDVRVRGFTLRGHHTQRPSSTP